MISEHFGIIFFLNFLSADRSIASRDLKNYLEVLWTIPDTLLNFCGIWCSRFRATWFPRLIFFRKQDAKIDEYP